MTLFSLLFSLSTADAVPVQLSQQGRLLDNTGAAMNGQHAMAFRFFDSQMGGNLVWEEGLQLTFVNGYYAAILGANTAVYPLDDSVLNSHPLFLEVEIDSNGPVGARQNVVSAPQRVLPKFAHPPLAQRGKLTTSRAPTPSVVAL